MPRVSIVPLVSDIRSCWTSSVNCVRACLPCRVRHAVSQSRVCRVEEATSDMSPMSAVYQNDNWVIRKRLHLVGSGVDCSRMASTVSAVSANTRQLSASTYWPSRESGCPPPTASRPARLTSRPCPAPEIATGDLSAPSATLEHSIPLSADNRFSFLHRVSSRSFLLPCQTRVRFSYLSQNLLPHKKRRVLLNA